MRAARRSAKPEELIRQLWIHTLLYRYEYPRHRIAVEYLITFGRDTSKRADIVVFDADRPTVPYLLVEVKQSTAKAGKEQLKSYGHATGAPLDHGWVREDDEPRRAGIRLNKLAIRACLH